MHVRHNRSRVTVDKYDLQPFFFQRTAGLSTGIVKLSSLTDNDRAGTDNKNFFDILQLWHQFWPPIIFTKRLNKYSWPPGPGLASG
jgi:hypothetical protein